MNRGHLTPHDRASLLIVGRRIAAQLAAKALDPASGLSWPVRTGLAALVLAVDLEAHRRAGVDPPNETLRAALTAALPGPEHSAALAGPKRSTGSAAVGLPQRCAE